MIKTNNEALVFTDQCYFVKREDNQKNLGQLGFTDYISESNHYGDWGAALFQVIDGIEHLMGRLCADAGGICMVKLKELMKYCPEFLTTQGQWTYAILPATFNQETEWEYIPEYKETGSSAILGRNKDGRVRFIVKQTQW